MAGSGWVLSLAYGVALGLAVACGKADDVTPDGSASGSSGGTAAGAGGAGWSGEPATSQTLAADGRPLLGRSCRRDDECGGAVGLRCWSAHEDHLDGLGAPPSGVCTADCSTDADCRFFDQRSVCASWAEVPLGLAPATNPVARLCMQGCALGAPSGPTKCHGRSDFACRPFAPANAKSCLRGEACAEGSFCFRGICRESACGPRCNSSDDCAGRYCNPSTGLCDEAEPQSVPIGAECGGDPDPTSECRGGVCLNVDDGGRSIKLTCTQSCTLGSLCAEGRGACVSPRFDNHALGDVGYCLQRCDCDDDCTHPADRCLSWGDDLTVAKFGSQGYCDYAVEGAFTLSCVGSASN